MKCSGVNKTTGEPCRWSAPVGRTFCLAHDPERVEEFMQSRIERGKRGAEITKARHAARKVKTSLKTIPEILACVERTVNALETSGAGICERANAISRQLALAAELLKVGELATENAELRRILVERFPDLRKHLKAVS